jgi:EAL domain-containing protein (putative c-di-GMP-specific phosphodiesterase class I)
MWRDRRRVDEVPMGTIYRERVGQWPGVAGSDATQRGEVNALLKRGPRALRIVFQPIVELATGRAAGYEALARFDTDPRRGPDAWFAQAHRVGLGDELEALALRAALAVPGRPEGTFLAVNVSPSGLQSRLVRDALPTDLSGLVIELTEHEPFGAGNGLDAALDALRARGARIALDDAGAGYAGLQQIIRVAPDILKLDRALVHGAHSDVARQALLEALIGFASTTGAVVCAEGVEGLDDLRALVDLDVTYAQGYGLARPGPPWSAVAAEATLAGAAEIRSGLRLAGRSCGALGSLARGIAELSDTLAAASSIGDLGAANSRAATLMCADDVALMRVHREAGELELLCGHHPGSRWSLSEFPATRSVLDHGIPGQVVVGDEAGDQAELAKLATIGMATALIVPVICGGRELAVLGMYRIRAQAFTAHEIDRARLLAQQFGGALARLT